MRVFLGVTGASGAPYADRLLQALVEAGCEVGLTASGSGIQVLATELYGDPSLTREEVLERFAGARGDCVTVYGESDYSSPYASGSAQVDAYVICPCSMATVGTLASGAMQNLIHRAASVALKERRTLVLVPRETPLSSIHLRGLATLNEAGAVILFAAPGFYHGAETVDDLVRFVVARCLDQLGIDNSLVARWGGSTVTYESGTLEAGAVRGMFDRIAPVYDAMNRVMTMGLDRRWRRLAARAVVWPGDRVLDACCGTGDLAVEAERRGGRVVGLDFSARMLERARRKSGTIEWVEGDALALPFADGEFDAVTIGFGVRNFQDLPRGLAELRRVLRPGGKIAVLEITRPRGLLRPFFRLWFDVLVPLAGKVLPGGKAYTYLPASVRRFPVADDLARLLEEAGFADVTYRRLGGGIVALHVASAGEERELVSTVHAVLEEARPYLDELEERLEVAVSRHPGVVERVGRTAISAGGKRLRPLLVHLTASDREVALRCGVAVELVHVATLVHDDVIDGAELRRGQASAWREHGAQAAKAGGDHLFARAFAELARAGDLEGVEILARSCLAIVRGEAMQRQQAHDPETPVEAYLERITLKTARLFEAACLLGSREPRLGEFGLALGVAFQIADDILDCVGDTIETGKVPGADLREGVPTLPLLLAAREDELVRRALAGGPLEEALVRVAATSALERSRELALDYARKARAFLRDEPELEALTHIVIDRER